MLNVLSIPLYGNFMEEFIVPKVEGENIAEKYLIHSSDINRSMSKAFQYPSIGRLLVIS